VSSVTGGPGPVVPGGSGVVQPPFHPGRFQQARPSLKGGCRRFFSVIADLTKVTIPPREEIVKWGYLFLQGNSI